MTKQDKLALIAILDGLEGICRRHHDKRGFRKCVGCPMSKAPVYGCSFYSILATFKGYGMNLMKLKYNEDPTEIKR